MRIRQVKPAYWTDALLQKEFTAALREFYMGTWMLADDDGWFRLNVAEIAGELYRYQPTRRREASVERYVARLRAAGRLEVHPCGHGHIPTLVRHQRFGGPDKRVYTIRDEHQRTCIRDIPPMPASPRGFPPDPAPERNGTEREVDGKEREREGSDGPIPPGREGEIARLRQMAVDPDVYEATRQRVKKTLRRYGVTMDEADVDGDVGVRE